MSNSKEQYVHFHNSLTEINRCAREEPQAFAQTSEQAYQTELRRIAEQAARETRDCRIVLLAGPSASGKTTTASLLSACLQQEGVSSFVFSLDNFYLPEEQSPGIPTVCRILNPSMPSISNRSDRACSP